MSKSWMTACLAVTIALFARDVRAHDSADVPEIKVLSARLVSEVKGYSDTSWSTDNPKRTGLAVAVEVSFSPSESGERIDMTCGSFFIEYKLGPAGPFEEECIAMAGGSESETAEWAISPRMTMRFGPPPKSEFVDVNRALLLFEVSKEIGAFTLVYRHPAARIEATVTP